MYQWDEKYSVGIQSIDNQHKEIISLLSNLFEALKNSQAIEVTTLTILSLEKYAMLHFQKEEFFFKRFNFHGEEMHCKEHDFFKAKVSELKNNLGSGKVTLSFDVLNFLKEWLEHHIMVVDKQYTECFHQNGLK